MSVSCVYDFISDIWSGLKGEDKNTIVTCVKFLMLHNDGGYKSIVNKYQNVRNMNFAFQYLASHIGGRCTLYTSHIILAIESAITSSDSECSQTPNAIENACVYMHFTNSIGSDLFQIVISFIETPRMYFHDIKQCMSIFSEYSDIEKFMLQTRYPENINPMKMREMYNNVFDRDTTVDEMMKINNISKFRPRVFEIEMFLYTFDEQFTRYGLFSIFHR
jgi:hypothetical protein